MKPGKDEKQKGAGKQEVLPMPLQTQLDAAELNQKATAIVDAVDSMQRWLEGYAYELHKEYVAIRKSMNAEREAIKQSIMNLTILTRPGVGTEIRWQWVRFLPNKEARNDPRKNHRFVINLPKGDKPRYPNSVLFSKAKEFEKPLLVAVEDRMAIVRYFNHQFRLIRKTLNQAVVATNNLDELVEKLRAGLMHFKVGNQLKPQLAPPVAEPDDDEGQQG